MSYVLQPWQLVLVILAAWMNQRQQETIECRQRLSGLLEYYYCRATCSLICSVPSQDRYSARLKILFSQFGLAAVFGVTTTGAKFCLAAIPNSAPRLGLTIGIVF